MRLPSALALLALTAPTSGCWLLHQAPEEPVQAAVAIDLRPLPGGLNDTPLFNSNNPETVRESGILLAAWPARTPAEQAVFQPPLPAGDFAIFSHHMAKDDLPGEHLLHVGLVAMNPGTKPLVLSWIGGSSHLSQPDSPFFPLPALVQDDEGKRFAGPGDCVSTDLLHARTPLVPENFTLAPGETVLVSDLTIPTDVPIPPPLNGRTTQLYGHADGSVAFADIALLVTPDAQHHYATPTKADYLAQLASLRRAGPKEPASSPYDVDGPIPKGYRYGRVAGVSQGTHWKAELFPDAASVPAPGQTVAFPIATAFANRLGTHQMQSAPMLSRYADTAYHAHGNYGLTYVLGLHLPNPTDQPACYDLALSYPLKVTTKPTAAAVYQLPPKAPIMFRGPIMTRQALRGGAQETHFTHLVLHLGEEGAPFSRVTVPPQGDLHVDVALNFPADSTPPELLTIRRESN